MSGLLATRRSTRTLIRRAVIAAPISRVAPDIRGRTEILIDVIVAERRAHRTGQLRFVAGRVHHQRLIVDRGMIDDRGDGVVVSAEELIVFFPAPAGRTFGLPREREAPRVVVAD